MLWIKRLLWPVLVVAAFAGGWLTHTLTQPAPDPALTLIDRAGRIISQEYYGEVPAPRELAYAAIRGMLSQLGDKYATFFEPTAAAREGLGANGNDAVIGLRGEVHTGTFVVTDVLPDGPAARAGLQIGDVVQAIDGWTITPGASSPEIHAMIRGAVGSTAHLTVRRGENVLSLEALREPYQEVTTQRFGDIAYLRFDRFTVQTPQQISQALSQALTTTTKSLILDLRYNGGGLMNSAQQILDIFLDDGLAFYARTKTGDLLPYPTKTSGEIGETIPLVVLISPHTYSAPETVAAAIADRGRGKLIGERTHGKGSINTTANLGDGSAIRITVAQWLSPVRQQSFEGIGVPPDIVVTDSPAAGHDTVLEYALAYLEDTQP
ncbi:MAG: PDZ domain-containing protein [Chloroflexi bacterium]|nr:PDZ domain-containing protein [Chloroflexota bacterium]